MVTVNLQRGPVRYQGWQSNVTAAPGAKESQGFFADLIDTYAIGIYGQMKDALEEGVASVSQPYDPNFDPLANVPKGYEQWAESYAMASNRAEIDTITRNIDENNAIRARQGNYSMGYNLLLGIAAGVVDPVNLVNPSLKGLGLLKGALKGGTIFGGINAGQELIRNELDPTSTNQETALNIGMGFLVSGLISGGIAHFSGSHRGTIDLDPEVRAKAEAVGDGFAETQAALDGLAVRDVIDFDRQGVRVVLGNTGKYDANGNYIRAFYRPKAAFEAEAQQGALSRAVDSALGDVVPEDPDALVPLPRAAVEVEAVDPVGIAPEAGLARLDGDDAPIALDAETLATDPFTGQPRAGGDGRAAAAPEGAAEDTIFIDDAAILAEFRAKPWTSPRYEGIEPLAEDAFKTPEEWLNFVVLHELNHKTSKRLPTETKAAYENRINRLALDEVNAGRLPLAPTDGVLEKLMLLPTPSGTLMRLAPRQREAHELAQGIAGDHATLTIANRMGRATTPGGSVFQRAQRWLVSNYVTAVEWQKAYARYLTGSEAGSEAGNAFEAFRAGLPGIGRRVRQGKLSPSEFRAYIGRAVYDDQPFEMFGKPLAESDMAIVRGAAREVRKLFGQFEAKARALGMFEAQTRVQRDIDWRSRANARDEARLEKLRPGSKLHSEISEALAARRLELDGLKTQLDEISAETILPARETYYFPRIYDVGKIKADRDAFTQLIAEAYGGNEAARSRAEQTVRRILNEGGIDEMVPGAGGPRNLLSREVPLTNRELADYIVHDVETVMGLYSRRMGASIEMVNKYGSRLLDEQLDSLRATLQDQGYDAKTIGKIIAVQEDMRDRVLGTFHSKDPMSWSNRTARAIKNYGSLTLMGRGVLSQTMDIARTVAVEGHKPLFQALHSVMRGELGNLQRGVYAKQAGEALELVNARWMAQLIENDSALAVTSQSALERGLAAAQSPFFQLNMMNPFTVVWKEFTSVMSSHMLLDESVKVAKAVRAGRTMASFTAPEKKMAEHLASWGIDLRRAQMIADMPIEKTDGSGLYLANLEAWSGRDGELARETFLGALSGTLRSGVVTPGPLQRASIMDGIFRFNGKRREFPLLSLPFQLLSFTMSASTKISHSLLSGRDRSRATTIGALLIGGYLSTWLKGNIGSDRWEAMDWKEIALESIENSSILGYLTDVYKRTEDLVGYGPRSALGMRDIGEDTVSDEIGAVAGPATSILAGAIEAFVSDNPDLDERERARLIKRAIPFGSLVWWDGALKDLSNRAAEAGWLETVTPGAGETFDFETGELAEELDDEPIPIGD